MLSDRSTNQGFYEEAAREIMNWLPDIDRLQILEENDEADTKFDERDAMTRFFYLLNYLETNYIDMPNRTSDIERQFAQLQKSLKETSRVKEIEIESPSGEYVSLSDLKLKVESSLDNLDLVKSFRGMLSEAHVLEDYELYLKSLDEIKRREKEL